MKEATVIQSFNDIKEGSFRKAGAAFLVDDERGAYLAGLGLVYLKDTPEAKPARKTTKKATKK